MEMQFTKSAKSEAAAAALRSRVLTGAAAAVAAVIGVSTSALGATPITPATENYWQHILDCAWAQINDPAAHEEFCLPGHTFFLPDSTGFSSTTTSYTCYTYTSPYCDG